jgi:PilZ domain
MPQMAERRSFVRKKRRFLVEFDLRGSHCTGFTYDVSPTGIFVRSIRLPVPGSFLTANLHLAEGRRIAVRGKVVRSFSVPTGLARLVPSGFSIALADTPEDYFQFLATL